MTAPTQTSVPPQTFDRDTLAMSYISSAKAYLIAALCLFMFWPLYLTFMYLTISNVNKARDLYAGTDLPRPRQIEEYKIYVWIPVMLFGAIAMTYFLFYFIVAMVTGAPPTL